MQQISKKVSLVNRLIYSVEINLDETNYFLKDTSLLLKKWLAPMENKDITIIKLSL
jgi:hypothetical protein